MSNFDDAVRLCREIEDLCPRFGCHVGLTGGCLYKDGNRKDIDIVFYRIRQVEGIDRDGLTEELGRKLGLSLSSRHGWMQKMSWDGKAVDVFFPEELNGSDDDYREHELRPADSIKEARAACEAMQLLDESF